MGNIGFRSQICTTKEQSERLLKLGLKKETADMAHYFSRSLAECWTIIPLDNGEVAENNDLETPAWSLHRLIDMLPHVITGLVISADGKEIRMFCYLRMTKGEVAYWYYNEDGIVEYYERFGGDDLYKNVIDIIEFLISENLFEKYYLEEKK